MGLHEKLHHLSFFNYWIEAPPFQGLFTTALKAASTKLQTRKHEAVKTESQLSLSLWNLPFVFCIRSIRTGNLAAQESPEWCCFLLAFWMFCARYRKWTFNVVPCSCFAVSFLMFQCAFIGFLVVILLLVRCLEHGLLLDKGGRGYYPHHHHHANTTSI